MDFAPGFAELFPILIVTIPVGIITIMLSKRKGRTAFWWKIVGFIPMVGYYFIFYLVGITDKAVYDKLDDIGRSLGAQPHG